MFRAIIFRCPYLKGSNEGAKCDAAICMTENNLIKYMEDVDIKLCINKKRRFEACYIYLTNLKISAISKIPTAILSHDSRPHAFDSL
jgi:hypothetical protein